MKYKCWNPETELVSLGCGWVQFCENPRDLPGNLYSGIDVNLFQEKTISKFLNIQFSKLAFDPPL